MVRFYCSLIVCFPWCLICILPDLGYAHICAYHPHSVLLFRNLLPQSFVFRDGLDPLSIFSPSSPAITPSQTLTHAIAPFLFPPASLSTSSLVPHAASNVPTSASNSSSSSVSSTSVSFDLDSSSRKPSSGFFFTIFLGLV